MKKYYLPKYDSRMGGDYCEVYNERLEKVETVKGKDKIEGLQEITNLRSTVAAVQKVKPLSDEFGLVVGTMGLTDEQIENVNRNLGIDR